MFLGIVATAVPSTLGKFMTWNFSFSAWACTDPNTVLIRTWKIIWNDFCFKIRTQFFV